MDTKPYIYHEANAQMLEDVKAQDDEYFVSQFKMQGLIISGIPLIHILRMIRALLNTMTYWEGDNVPVVCDIYWDLLDVICTRTPVDEIIRSIDIIDDLVTYTHPQLWRFYKTIAENVVGSEPYVRDPNEEGEVERYGNLFLTLLLGSHFKSGTVPSSTSPHLDRIMTMDPVIFLTDPYEDASKTLLDQYVQFKGMSGQRGGGVRLILGGVWKSYHTRMGWNDFCVRTFCVIVKWLASLMSVYDIPFVKRGGEDEVMNPEGTILHALVQLVQPFMEQEPRPAGTPVVNSPIRRDAFMDMFTHVYNCMEHRDRTYIRRSDGHSFNSLVEHMADNPVEEGMDMTLLDAIFELGLRKVKGAQ